MINSMMDSLFTVIAVYFLVIFPGAWVFLYFERKLVADLQARVGPNRTAAKGFFQPLADLLKSLQKNDQQASGFLKSLASVIYVMALFSTVAVLPLGSFSLLIDSDMSAFLPFWIALSLALSVSILGFEQKNIAGWLGSSRISAQAFAGAVPALMTLLCVGVRAGSFQWSKLADSQGFSPVHWAVFSNPFQFLACLIFLMSGLVLLGSQAADSGMTTQLTGFRGSVFRLGRYYAFFLWAIITTTLFLGAWKIPLRLSSAFHENSSLSLLKATELAVLLVKAYFLMFVISWMNKSNPQGRVDQVTDFSWRILSPLALLALAGSGLWAGMKVLL